MHLKETNILLTTHTLSSYIENNDQLNLIFNYTDSNQIAYILLSELNNIINIITPQRRIQKSFAPYIDKNLKSEIEHKNILYKNISKLKIKLTT